MAQTKLYVGDEPACFVTNIVPSAWVSDGKNVLLLQQSVDGGSQPHVVFGVLRLPANSIQNAFRKMVATNNHKVRECARWMRLLLDCPDFHHAGLLPLSRNYPVFGELFQRGFLDCNHRCGPVFEDTPNQPLTRLLRNADVIAQQESEGLPVQVVLAREDCVSQASSLLLPYIEKIRQPAHCADLFEMGLVAPVKEVLFELRRSIKVVLDASLVPTGDEKDVAVARGDRFFNNILDCRLVKEREHFLRGRFRVWQEPGA